MKKTIYTLALIGLFQFGCTDNFDEINTDPTRASQDIFDANLLLPSIQWRNASATAGYNGGILFQSMWVKILASTTSGAANYYSNADKYVISSNTNSYLASVWNTDFGAASFAFEMEQLTKDRPELANLMNIAIIMQVQSLANISDVYGDIPYSEALRAKSDQITLPAYDTQESIYGSLLSRLDAAVSALDPAGIAPTNDAYSYDGDITKWKKFGYSLMLKLAMRLTKVDEAMAKTYAEKAAAGGTFASIADDAYIMADQANGYNNGNGSALSTPADIYQVRWSQRMIDYLQANDDPRLGKIAEVPAAGLAANQSIDEAGDMTPANQIGLPNGYDLNGGATDISNAPNYPGPSGSGANVTPIGKYSRPTSFYRDRSAPLFVLTYAQTELLLAEAATRGFSVGGTAADHYMKAVSAGIQSLAPFGSNAAIGAATADAYAAEHPLVEAMALQQINEQYWATTGLLFNFVEAWNNWKRTGYPELTPINYVGNFSGGAIPRRQPYPTTEATYNGVNYQAAVGRLSSGDNWVSRSWWDK
ncbi:SusD-like starch-binding protein associating with outer membrane [Dyadobacter jejuensis]|uniref:SusD-like starch-binding protein associating with outer membrane n=1 Tax=Dyadobacter jejuensis TaxID=1082580 RepID=A0A316AHB9_9BACT|nr:SusD/RagB family nutrient-binding outer membrane lipoprotein [Dyadobacter jejuensis]PWJ57135.1 SusD-like starch-binding protein associating with outer membrane [Dyadobacter jejuensis]